MDAEEVRLRLSQLMEDFEARASKTDGLVPDQSLAIVSKLVDLAKEHLPDDPVLHVVELPDRPKYSDLYPILRQVVLALPASVPFA